MLFVKMTDEERREALASAHCKIREWFDEHGDSPHDRRELMSAVEEEEAEFGPLAGEIRKRLTERELSALTYEFIRKETEELFRDMAARPLPVVHNEDTFKDLAIMLDEDTCTIVPLLQASWPHLMFKQQQVEQTGDREQIERWKQLLRRLEPIMKVDPMLQLEEALRVMES